MRRQRPQTTGGTPQRSHLEPENQQQEAVKQHHEDQAFIGRLRELLFPQSIPLVPSYDLGWEYWPTDPTEGVTGDFYDAVVLDDEFLNFTIGDVSGKGFAAASRSLSVWNMWRAFVADNMQPGLLLKRLNKALGHYLEPDQFVTMLCGCIHLKTGLLQYARAGHPYPILRRATGTCEFLTSDGSPLGVSPDSEYAAPELVLKTGDMLLLYTDGMSELRRGSTFLEIEGVLRWLETCPTGSPNEVITALRQKALDWSDDKSPDDVALFVLQRNA